MRPRPRSLVATAALVWLATGLTCQSVAVEAIELEVRETAGIRRFGYPVRLKLPGLTLVPANARLRDGSKQVAAQVRQEDGGAGDWWLDFNLSLLPNEARTLTLEYGADVVVDAESRGLELRQTSDGFEIRNGQHLTWSVGRDLHELLKSVEAGALRHLRGEGARFGIEGANEAVYGDKASPPRILRSGPLAVAIRYEFAPKTGSLAGIKSTVDLTFPVSKSWVEVEWQIEDPRQTVRSVRVDLAQNLDSPTDKQPTLVDFGASSLVYMSLTPGTAGKFSARMAADQTKSVVRQSWEVLRGAKDRLEPFVVRSSDAQGGDAQGWAHMMDRQRCLALAIDEFGKGGDDSIETTAEGNISLTRRFAGDERDRPATKHYHFWLHFVGFPPHLTAATSPQSMLSPLSVQISKPKGRSD